MLVSCPMCDHEILVEEFGVVIKCVGCKLLFKVEGGIRLGLVSFYSFHDKRPKVGQIG